MSALAFATPSDAPAWKRWLLFSPPARIFLFGLFMALLLAATWGAVTLLGWNARDATREALRTGFFLQLVVPTLGAYLLLVLWIERRRPRELAWATLLPGALAGIVGGCLLVGSVMAVLWLAGAYQPTGLRSDVPWVAPLLLGGLGTAIAEEIVFRGALFRITEEGLGTAAALGLSALLFGAVHLANPGATWWSTLAIALEAGLLLGLVYQVWRSLPVCIGLHMAWNFLEGTVFGSAVSGSGGQDSWIVADLRGSDWLTGGPFGVEGSVLTVAVCLLVSLGLLALSRRRGTWVPFRPRRRAAARIAAAADNASVPA